MPTDAMTLKRIDHVRMFVGNARQSAYFYRNAFGFDVIAYGGLETGMKHEACYVLRQGQITFVLASPLSADHPEAHRLVRHGDGVQSIALEVDDVAAAFDARRGAGCATRVTAAHASRTSIGIYRSGRDPRLRRHDAHASSTVALSRCLRPGIQAARPRSLQPPHVPSGRPEGHRPHRRQRRGRQDGRLGRLLQQGHGLLAAGQLRRQGHQHRILGSDVEGGRRWTRPDQVPDQRAGQEPAPVPDR